MPDLKNTPSLTVNGSTQCDLLTFEGLGLNNFDPVPPLTTAFTIAFFSGWIALLPISEGGTGNIANLPSPITTVFFKDPPGFRDIIFTNPIASIDLKYASTDTVTMEAFDTSNNLLATVSAPGNFNGVILDTWDPLSINLGSNVISRIRFSGPISNFAIDNVNLCVIVPPTRGVSFRCFSKES